MEETEDKKVNPCGLVKLTFVISGKTIEMTLDEAKILRDQLNGLLGNPIPFTMPSTPDILKPYKIERPDTVPWRVGDDPYYPYPANPPIYFTTCYRVYNED